MPQTPPDGAPVPSFGLRTFEEISASMAALTTVSPQHPDVQFTYQRVKQQLPTVENLGSFLAAHQMAVAQLAIEYCNALIDDSTKRQEIWPFFDFDANLNAVFGPTAERDDALVPLVDRIVLPDYSPEGAGQSLSTQPTFTAIESELNGLIDELINCRQGPPPHSESTPRGIQYCTNQYYPDRTKVVMKAVCAAAIGNAAMLVQ